ncbi:hypothetical protein [Phenylobacterium sp.]|uniref:hypothetical protein n=1 Tax=Phenylobacterium sp. TaxID=1871053 RepID=UPI0035B04C3C
MDHPAPSSNGPGRPAVARASLGVILTLVGSLTLCLLVWMSNSGAALAQKLMFAMGLALTSLVSATAQALVFAGLWLLWRAVHHREQD